MADGIPNPSASAGAGSEAGDFGKPRAGVEDEPTPHLYVANCGPAAGLSHAAAARAFARFGEVAAVCAAGDSGTRVVVSFRSADDAAAAKRAWNGRPCDLLQGRTMRVQYAVKRAWPIVPDPHPVMTSSAELGIPGLVLYLDFVSGGEEEKLLAAVDSLPWQALAKRRVQHFGQETSIQRKDWETYQLLWHL